MFNNYKEDINNSLFSVNIEKNVLYNKENLFLGHQNIFNQNLYNSSSITPNILLKEKIQETCPVKINFKSKENLEWAKTDLKINYVDNDQNNPNRKVNSCSYNTNEKGNPNVNYNKFSNANNICNNYFSNPFSSDKNFNPFEKFNYQNLNQMNMSVENRIANEYIPIGENITNKQSINKKPQLTQSDSRSLMLSLSKMSNCSNPHNSYGSSVDNVTSFSQFNSYSSSNMQSSFSPGFSLVYSNTNQSQFASGFQSTSSMYSAASRPAFNVNNFGNAFENTNYIAEDENETDESFSQQYKDQNASSSNPFLKEYEKKLLIPKEKKNNESYKLLKINKNVKRVEASTFSSTRRINDYKKMDTDECDDPYNYNILKKKKKVHSVKKIFVSETKMINTSTNQVKTFKIFRDSEIGINEYWQSHIVSAENDEDLETEDEQIKIAEEYIKREMKLTIMQLTQPNCELEITNRHFLHD